VALFFEFVSHEKCSIVLDGATWTVETRQVKHSVKEESYAY
tara:strand:+ start:407 stop:529 length:123 start_codon:yes stop_codon:yes gene_type:complete